MNFTSDSIPRIVTAASLFDGHDAAINIMRRILQQKGAEVIHLGHNRSVREIVEAAIEEDAHAIAITSYQGGHVEFFKYMKDLLAQSGCGHIRLFGGGGGTILPEEIRELHQYGIERIYSPDDGRQMGLEGMIDDLLARCRKSLDEFHRAPAGWSGKPPLDEAFDIRKIARAITMAELKDASSQTSPNDLHQANAEASLNNQAPVLGITGTGGAGKSSVTDELVRRYVHAYPELTIAVLSVDPSKRKTGGALLGDRIRMNSIHHPRAYMRSLATRHHNTAISSHLPEAIAICRQAGYHLILLESAGVGQSDASLVDLCDVSLYVMTPEYGAASQLEKINMLDYADVIAINKFDKAGALDALAEVRKQYKRNHGRWKARDEDLPVVGTIASKFNDAGVNKLFALLMHALSAKAGFAPLPDGAVSSIESPGSQAIIPASRVRYLSEISDTVRQYNQWAKEQGQIASALYKLKGALNIIGQNENATGK